MNQRLLAQRTLELSLLLLTAIVLVALSGLALDRSWPKLLRVASAFLTYVSALWLLARRHAAPPLFAFVLAGAAARVVSAFVRPDALPLNSVIAQVGGAGFLLGPVHWAALRYRHLAHRLQA